jgi:hypothetical protein
VRHAGRQLADGGQPLGPQQVLLDLAQLLVGPQQGGLSPIRLKAPERIPISSPLRTGRRVCSSPRATASAAAVSACSGRVTRRATSATSSSEQSTALSPTRRKYQRTPARRASTES